MWRLERPAQSTSPKKGWHARTEKRELSAKCAIPMRPLVSTSYLLQAPRMLRTLVCSSGVYPSIVQCVHGHDIKVYRSVRTTSTVLCDPRVERSGTCPVPRPDRDPGPPVWAVGRTTNMAYALWSPTYARRSYESKTLPFC